MTAVSFFSANNERGRVDGLGRISRAPLTDGPEDAPQAEHREEGAREEGGEQVQQHGCPAANTSQRAEFSDHVLWKENDS